MSFNFVIKKWGIFYFFIQNLSEWHFCNRREYNIKWKEDLPNFSLEEKKVLFKFKKLHSHYSFGELYLGRSFFTKKDPLVFLKQKLPKKDFAIIESCFLIFKKRFALFYKKELPLLKRWQIILKRKIDKKQMDEIDKTVSELYNSPSLSEIITVYLLPSTENYMGGMGGVINDTSILLEISRLPIKKLNQALGIIWHEILHLSHYKKWQITPLLIKKLGNNKKAINLSEEMIITSLFPNGTLGARFLKNKSQRLNKNLSHKKANSLIKLSDQYLIKGKAIDERYLDALFKIISFRQ